MSAAASGKLRPASTTLATKSRATPRKPRARFCCARSGSERRTISSRISTRVISSGRSTPSTRAFKMSCSRLSRSRSSLFSAMGRVLLRRRAARGQGPWSSEPGAVGEGIGFRRRKRAPRLLDVTRDLYFELGQPGEFLFATQVPLQVDAQGLAVQILVEVEQVHLDAEAGLDRRAKTDVGDPLAESHARITAHAIDEHRIH